MMKMFKCAVLLLVCFVMVISAALSTAAESGYLRGDADNDGDVTILDATTIQRVLVHLNVQSYNEKAADSDGDGEVTIVDATMIQRYLVRLYDPYHIGERFEDGTAPTEKDYELPFVPR